MSPAEKLSAAAARLRELANAAPDFPSTHKLWASAGSPIVIAPPFALALADWLDAEAEHVASYDCMAHCEPAGCDRGHKALAVAVLILPADSDRAAGQGQVTA